MTSKNKPLYEIDKKKQKTNTPKAGDHTFITATIKSLWVTLYNFFGKAVRDPNAHHLPINL